MIQNQNTKNIKFNMKKTVLRQPLYYKNGTTLYE